MGGCSITKDVHVGDLVELLVDGKFYGRTDGVNEMYAGYVTSIDDFIVRLSSTHTNNNCHGYTRGEDKQLQTSVRVESFHIKEYRILNAT